MLVTHHGHLKERRRKSVLKRGNTICTPPYLKAVAKIDVSDLASFSIQHDVGGMSVAQSKNVPNH